MTCVGNHGNNLTNQSDVTVKTEEGAFHSAQNSGLKFWKLPLTNGTAVSEISGKDRITSRVIPKFLGIILMRIFPPGIFG